MTTPTTSERSERLRIDDLAQASGIASGTIRFYQREGLIPAPERQGRVAWYGAEHVRRLERIRALQGHGLPLALIRDLLEREERGDDVAPWLELDSAVFAHARESDTVAAARLELLGLEREDIAALEEAGFLTRRADGDFDAVPGTLELTTQVVNAGVAPGAYRMGAQLVGERLRAVAEAMADLGWEQFAAERQRIESGEEVAPEVLAKLEQMRAVAAQIVGNLFPLMLDEATRRRAEEFALEVVRRRSAGA